MTVETMTKPLSRNMKHQQDQNKILRKYKLRLLKEPYDEHLMATDQRALKYIAQDSRLILKDGLLFRQYYSKNRNCQMPSGTSPRTPS